MSSDGGTGDGGCALGRLDAIYAVPGIGLVVGLVMQRGRLATGDRGLVGPDRHGHFTRAVIRSVFVHRTDVGQACEGQLATVGLRLCGGVSGKMPKRKINAKVLPGMVLLAAPAYQTLRPPRTGTTFEADVRILYHQTTITLGYTATVHCSAIRQAASIEAIQRRATSATAAARKSTTTTDAQYLRSGDSARVRLRFCLKPECILPGSRFIFREGRVKALGRVVRVLQ